ncbi:methyltransferase [Apibacter mensalis]|uniref:methyltransferase n=1 Tax=Apibacter mensalis TaxID=1586267 RepID=UPI0026E99A3D|nr:methyltransferase [Apibacter mensalis]
MEKKIILDACCGPKMMWFDKKDPRAVYMDIRIADFIACDGRRALIDPDVIGDFRKMPFDDNSFKMVVFDPPHLNKLGQNSFTAQKYGKLFPTWEDDLKSGFEESMRVLQKEGFLIFKWNEYEISIKKIIEIFGVQPLFGHKSGKQSLTHWLCFIKD